MTASDCDIPHRAPPPTPAEIAVAYASSAWEEDIIDPPDTSAKWATSRGWIRRFIGEGLGWFSDAKRYQFDGQFAWCGAFAAWCWRDTIPLTVRRVYLASTYRLSCIASGKVLNRVDTPRMIRAIQPAEVQPGDIITVGSAKVYGDHICLVAQLVSGGPLYTIEGNGIGIGPMLDQREGVVTNKRWIGDIRLALRVA